MSSPLAVAGERPRNRAKVSICRRYSCWVLSLKLRTVMSAIMRRRRSLIGLSFIEGSCPEGEVWNSQSSGRDARHVIVCQSVGRHGPCRLLRSARSALPRERVRSVPLNRPSLRGQEASEKGGNATFDRGKAGGGSNPLAGISGW